MVTLGDIPTPRSVIGVFSWIKVETTSKQKRGLRETGRVVKSVSDYPANGERSACDDRDRSDFESHLGGL
jgi:hypothetical protein